MTPRLCPHCHAENPLAVLACHVCGEKGFPKVTCRGCRKPTCCIEFFGPRKVEYCKTCHKKKTETRR